MSSDDTYEEIVAERYVALKPEKLVMDQVGLLVGLVLGALFIALALYAVDSAEGKTFFMCSGIILLSLGILSGITSELVRHRNANRDIAARASMFIDR